MEKLQSVSPTADIEAEQKKLRTELASETNAFRAFTITRAIAAYNVLKTGRKNDKIGICVATTLAYTHGVKNAFLRLEYDSGDIKQVADKLAKQYGHNTELHLFGWGDEELTQPKLGRYIRDANIVWIAVRGRPDHMFGILKGADLNQLRVWDIGGDSLQIRKNKFTSFQTMNLGQLYSRTMRSTDTWKSAKLISFF